MPENKKKRNPAWLVAALGVTGVVSLVIGLAVLPKDSPATSASSAPVTSPSAEASTTPPPPGMRNYPNGTRGLGEPYLFGSPNAKRTLAIWEDMECPACAAFEYDAQQALGDALAAGEIAIEYFIAPTDRAGSVDAAVAMACAADQDYFKDMHLTLFSNQFPEEDKGYSPEMLIEIAELTEMPDLDSFEQCLRSDRYLDYVASIVDRGIEEKVTGTPFIVLDGEELNLGEIGWEGFISAIGLDPEDYPYETGE